MDPKRKAPKGLPGILENKAYLPRGCCCLGERHFLGSRSAGTAEAETFTCCHFESAHLCRCFCIYFVCFFGRVSPTLRVLRSRAVHFLTLRPVEPWSGPSKHTYEPAHIPSGFTKMHFGGPGGNRTRVQNAFLSTSYSNNSQYIFI